MPTSRSVVCASVLAQEVHTRYHEAPQREIQKGAQTTMAAMGLQYHGRSICLHNDRQEC
jgi:hypothetical protein